MSSVSLLKNVGWLTFAYLVSRGASLIWQLFLARLLSQHSAVYGQLGVLVSTGAIFFLIAEFGLNLVAQQEWPKSRATERELFGILAVLRLATGAAAAVLFCLCFYVLYGRTSITAAAVPYALSLFLNGQTQTVLAVWEAKQNMRVTAIAGMLQTLLLVSLQLGALKKFGTLESLAAASMIASFLTTLLTWRLASVVFGLPTMPKKTRPKQLMRDYLRLAFPIMLSALVYVLYYRVDMILLSKWVSDEAAGVFAIASMLFMGLVDVTWSQLGRAVFPALSTLWHSDGDKKLFFEKVALLNEAFLLLSLFVLAGLLTAGPMMFGLVFGGSSPWLGARVPLIILCFSYWPLVVFALVYRVLLLAEKGRWYLTSVFAATVCKLILAWLLIRQYGPLGASFSNTICQYLMTGIAFLGLRKDLVRAVPVRLLFISFVGYLLTVGLWFLTQQHSRLFAVIVQLLPIVMLVIACYKRRASGFRFASWVDFNPV